MRRVRGTEEAAPVRDVYDLSTPLWQKYYEKLRKQILFPRYYKHELNW